jgi:hypothetical protein
MSGGPIYDREGNLCGLVSVRWKDLTLDRKIQSFGALLWPILAVDLIRLKTEDPEPSKHYWAYQAAADGVFQTKGLDWIDTREESDQIRVILCTGPKPQH